MLSDQERQIGVISKLFEHAILDRFGQYFLTSDNQFGIMINLSCRHVIYNVRNVIDHYTEHSSTANVYSLDLSKAVDRMNQYVLLIQELSYRKQIARQLRTLEGIHRPKYYTVTLKSRLRVTQGHWKRNHWTDHTRLTISRVI